MANAGAPCEGLSGGFSMLCDFTGDRRLRQLRMAGLASCGCPKSISGRNRTWLRGPLCGWDFATDAPATVHPSRTVANFGEYAPATVHPYWTVANCGESWLPGRSPR